MQVAQSNVNAPASDRQMAFIRSLVDEKQIPDMNWLNGRLSRPVTRQFASKLISRLLELENKPSQQALPLPEKHQIPELPRSGYAIDYDGQLRFYHVDRPTKGKYEGWTFVRERRSDGSKKLHYSQMLPVLEIIARNPVEAAERFGRELGECSCCHKSLTDETSRARGIGPVCAKERGW